MRRLALALLLLAGCAQAATRGIASIDVRTWPSLSSVAVTAIVSGDDDSSAVLRIFQKPHNSSAPFDTGMVMLRRVGTTIHEGRILWLTPGQEVDFYIAGDDDSGPRNSPVFTVQCSAVRPIVSTGPVFYVAQATGSDGNPGTKALPFKTINAGLTALANSPNSGRDGGVIVGIGEYHERLSLNWGTDGYNRFLMGDNENPDSTIICGANTWAEQGLSGPSRPISWSLVPCVGCGSGPLPDLGVDSLYKTYYPASLAGSSPGDSVQNVVIGWGECLHRKTSIAAVLNDSTWTQAQQLNMGELSGWFWQNDTLYVKRKNGQSPAGIVLHVGYLDELVRVDRRNWHISRLTMRFAGGIAQSPYLADVDPGENGYGVFAARFSNASGLVVDSCRFYGNNQCAVAAINNDPTSRADTVTIANSITDGLTIGSMSYDSGKSRAEENAGSFLVTGSRSNVFRCTVREVHNGIQTGPGVVNFADSTWSQYDEVAQNQISNTSDDAIELDATHGINELVMNNTTRLTGSACSVCGCYTGPVMVFDNLFTQFKAAGIKTCGTSTARLFACNNTIASWQPGSRALEAESGGSVDWQTYTNNIFMGALVAIAALNGIQTTNSFNWNMLDSSYSNRLIRVSAVPQGYGIWQAPPYSFEHNGQLGAPFFRDYARNLYQLTPRSPAWRTGRRVTGVNTSVFGPRYVGAPNIGFFECPTGDCQP